MAVLELRSPGAGTAPVTEPTMVREEVFLAGGEKFLHDGFKLTVPKGKYYRIIVKAIIHELTQEEYAKTMEGGEK